jgi:Domain of unknown function (DUF4326)
MSTQIIPYVKNFLSKEEADALFAFAQTLRGERKVNPRNPKSLIRKVSLGCFSILPESRTGATVHGGGAEGFDKSPDEVKAVAAKLTEYAKKEVNYLSFLAYENEKDHIGFHNHREDLTLKDMTVYVINLGCTRTLTTRPNGGDRSSWRFVQPSHGSLYVIPHSFNTTHEHAILDSKTPPANTFERPEGPPRIWCQRKGCEYPADAVNVDRYTIFGNHNKLNGDAWLAECAEQMRRPGFAAKVEELRGKDLLCWCRPDEESRCHAREWLRLANEGI